MAEIFYNIDKDYALGEFDGEGLNLNHLVDIDGDHAACGLALGGSAETGQGKVTCPKCIRTIEFYKVLRKGRDYL